jgi:hypothetical protein
MLKQLILHIGRHKSGTSSIQQYLAENREGLEAQGILFPFTGARNRIGHHQLADQLNPKVTDGAELETMLSDLRAEIRPGHETVVLTSEAMQGITETDRLARLQEALPAEKTVVICYFREHVDYAQSAYRQMLQAQPRFMTFPDYIKRFRDSSDFIARWRAIGDLRMKWFDRGRFKGGDVITDFCSEAGIRELPRKKILRNPSIGGNLLYFKLLANRLGNSFLSYGEMTKLAEAHEGFRPVFRLPSGYVRKIRKNSTYNASLVPHLGAPRLLEWDDMPELPILDRLDADVAVIEAADKKEQATWLADALAAAPLPDLIWGDRQTAR